MWVAEPVEARETRVGRRACRGGSLSLSKRRDPAWVAEPVEARDYSPIRSQSSATFSQAFVPDFRMIGQPAVFCVPKA